jgi:hypothetical protein
MEMKRLDGKVHARDRRRKDIVEEFKRLFNCTRITNIFIRDVDYFEQDMKVCATLYDGKYLKGHVGVFMQFESDGSITKGSGGK